MSNRVIVIGVVAGVLISAAVAWYFFPVETLPKPRLEEISGSATEGADVAPGFAAATGTQAEATQGPLAPPRAAPAGYKEYRNTAYRFSLFYPQDLTVHEYDEGGGASTITFENAAAVQGFQIFIVPYAGSQVTTAQFKQDEPSGVMKEPQNIQLDGALATIFFSTNPLLGDTREVWAIHGGYLFEVTTPKLLDEWLGNIMLTWKWI